MLQDKYATWVIRIEKEMPEIGLRPGDRIIIQLDHPTMPVTLERDLPQELLAVILRDPSATSVEFRSISRFSPRRLFARWRGRPPLRLLRVSGESPNDLGATE
jgi:hypothetical protein